MSQFEESGSSRWTDARVASFFLLLAKTRKEEITRFDKAQSDVEFGKMLKSRFLSPEQTELQTQLRRNMKHSGGSTSDICGSRLCKYLRSSPSPSKIGSPKWRTTYKRPKRSSMSSKQDGQASSKHPDLLPALSRLFIFFFLRISDHHRSTRSTVLPEISISRFASKRST